MHRNGDTPTAAADPAAPPAAPLAPRAQGGRRRGRRRRLGLVVGALALAVELLVLRRRGWGWGGRVVVRCRSGHLYTTLWVPAASLKSLRLGPWRIQRCPVGRHISLVTPAVRGALSPAELELAATARDVRIP